MAKKLHNPALAIFMDSWDDGDPWGSAMEAAWAIAVVSYAQGVTEAVYALDYKPSPLGSPTWDDLLSDATEGTDITIQMNDLAEAVEAERVSDEDLTQAAKIITRYLNICKLADRDY